MARALQVLLALPSLLLLISLGQARRPDFEHVDWGKYRYSNGTHDDWYPVGLCQGDCEREIYGDRYCAGNLECRFATPQDYVNDTCGGWAVVGISYCLPPSGRNPLAIPVTWKDFTWNAALRSWTLPTCSGGCRDSAICTGGGGTDTCVKVDDAEDLHPACQANKYLYSGEWYCVPDVSRTEFVVGAPAVKLNAAAMASSEAVETRYMSHFSLIVMVAVSFIL